MKFNFDIKVEFRVIEFWTSEIEEICIWRNLNLKKGEAEHTWMGTKFEIKEIWLNQANQVNTRNPVKSR